MMGNDGRRTIHNYATYSDPYHMFQLHLAILGRQTNHRSSHDFHFVGTCGIYGLLLIDQQDLEHHTNHSDDRSIAYTYVIYVCIQIHICVFV